MSKQYWIDAVKRKVLDAMVKRIDKAQIREKWTAYWGEPSPDNATMIAKISTLGDYEQIETYETVKEIDVCREIASRLADEIAEYVSPKVLSVQGREAGPEFSATLEKKGIAYHVRDVGDDVKEYTYVSPIFGSVFAYERVAQYDCDGFWQSIIITDKPLPKPTQAAMREIENGWRKDDQQEQLVAQLRNDYPERIAND